MSRKHVFFKFKLNNIINVSLDYCSKSIFLSGINILRKKFHGRKSKLIYMYINNVFMFLYVIKAKKNNKCDKIMLNFKF